jgi:CRISPR-associated endonuclease/helicase Cas3
MPEELLAKSPRGSFRLSLEQHLLQTEQAAVCVFRLDRRWGQAFCRFFKIAEGERERFLLHLQIAALFHDLGKANRDFYDSVTRQTTLAQTLRHEHLSALVLHLPEVRAWLAQNPALDLGVITAAVLSHHLKASENGEYPWCSPRGATSMVLYLEHAEVGRILGRIASVAGLGPAPRLPAGSWVVDTPPWKAAWLAGCDAATALRRDVRKPKNAARRALLLATKAGVIVADSVASGLVRENHPIEAWIDDVVHRAAIGPDDVEQAILAPRIKEIVRTKGAFTYQDFQLATAEQGARAVVLAPCGAGKTLAAWKWAEAQARDRAIGKVVFLYPTRGTATEGFRDYVSWAPEAEAALVHGTARYELEAMRQNPADTGEKKSFGLSEADARLFALGLWSRRYFSATVDQFLGFMEHDYKSLCLLPLFADAAVVIDEVHSFDKHMFAVLVSFLREFEVPVLCMTASLSESRRGELERAGLRAYPDRESRGGQLQKKEEHPRYRLREIAGEAEALAEAARAYREGRRVLWVVNQVARCQRLAVRLATELATDLRPELDERVLCYHSRFRLQDRRTAHERTVAAFQQQERRAVAVTTQVCEMSLDLDADVLITEIAPAPSLVQRFGRSNRHLARGADFRADLLVYAPEDALPYTQDEMAAGRSFLRALGDREVSQRDLAAALETHAPAEPTVDEAGSFLSGGYYATPGAFRDTDESARPCVLDDELPEVEEALAARQPIDGWMLNVPRRAVLPGAPPAWLPRYLGVAPKSQYRTLLGFFADPGDLP